MRSANDDEQETQHLLEETYNRASLSTIAQSSEIGAVFSSWSLLQEFSNLQCISPRD